MALPSFSRISASSLILVYCPSARVTTPTMGGQHSSRPHVCPRNDTHRGWATLISSARLPSRLPPVPVCPSACTTTPVVGVYHPRRITTILILAYQHRSSSRIPLCKQVHFR
ncbi:hypothetical protein C8F01DRAFT_1173789 [Mycena amicta]|nr:hypothetical protein C8F01DRAFT_1173789 [Mycena amicta]